MTGEIDKNYSQTASTVSINEVSNVTPWNDVPELFALDDKGSQRQYKTVDDCLDQIYEDEKECYSIASLIQGQGKPKRQKTKDLRPIAFVRLNTRVGKPKPVTIRVLLDIGGSETLITEEFVKKLKVKTTDKPLSWSTPGGKMTTSKKVNAQFTIPELQDDKLIEWDLHVTKNLGAYDMIIGRDIYSF